MAASAPTNLGGPTNAGAPALADAAVRYNVDAINAIRAERGLPPYVLDPQLSAFARQATERFSRDRVGHAHMRENGSSFPGFRGRRGENQGVARGGRNDPSVDMRPFIDTTLRWMMGEGPGGGHHDAIVSPVFRRIGVGLLVVNGTFFLTNDFSE